MAGAAPAAADPPRPTDYRSTVTAVTPAADGVRAEIVGGDAFLELRVDEGTRWSCRGTEGEPYLRFRADGTVERNIRSPATYLNDDRQGAVDLPPRADAEAEPEWEPWPTGARTPGTTTGSTGWRGEPAPRAPSRATSSSPGPSRSRSTARRPR